MWLAFLPSLNPTLTQDMRRHKTFTKHTKDRGHFCMKKGTFRVRQGRGGRKSEQTDIIDDMRTLWQKIWPKHYQWLFTGLMRWWMKKRTYPRGPCWETDLILDILGKGRRRSTNSPSFNVTCKGTSLPIPSSMGSGSRLNPWSRVSNVIDYSLTRNYVQLCVIIFISCDFAGLRVIEEISISQSYGLILCNFYEVNSRNFLLIMRN